MCENETRRCADEPEKDHEWRGDVEEGETDDEEGCVEEFLSDDPGANLDGFRGACVVDECDEQERKQGGRTKLVYRGKPTKEKCEGDEEEWTRDAIHQRVSKSKRQKRTRMASVFPKRGEEGGMRRTARKQRGRGR